MWRALSISVSGCMRVMTCQYSALAAASSRGLSVALQLPNAGGTGMPVSLGMRDSGASRCDSIDRMLDGGLSGPGHRDDAQLVFRSRRCCCG
ncbi:hypothetical protein D3C86_954690 [compost metagenome]